MEKKLLDFNFSLLQVDGTPITDEKGIPLNAGRILANTLYSGADKDPVKVADLARKIYNGDALDLDKSDTSMLKEIIKASKLFNGVKAQLLDVFES